MMIACNYLCHLLSIKEPDSMRRFYILKLSMSALSLVTSAPRVKSAIILKCD